MNIIVPNEQFQEGSEPSPPRDIRALSIRILHHANSGVTRVPFLRAMLNTLLEFSKCDAIEIRVSDIDLNYSCEASGRPKKAFTFQSINSPVSRPEKSVCKPETGDPLEQLCSLVMNGSIESASRFLTKNGSFWINDSTVPLNIDVEDDNRIGIPEIRLESPYKSAALIPFVLPNEGIGLLHMKSLEKFFFTEREIETYEGVAQTIGLAIADRRARAECNERVKELTCLYGVARVAGEPDLSLDEKLLRVAALLPPAWQYPNVTTARITMDGRAFESAGFREGMHRQTAQIRVNGAPRGLIDVFYLEEKPVLHEGPFLNEERSLIDTVAQEVALMIDRHEAETYKSVLQEQLRHADRLATIGQLVAGVAHELNEPLGAILGFAQLAQKCEGLPEQCGSDLEKIVKAALHAREVVKKLLFFSRQMPAVKTLVDLNKLVAEGLYFVESRCAKQQIGLVRDLGNNLPLINADSAQIHQVLVNLVVNSVQAMPDGGKLTIKTRPEGEYVALIVEDTGPGMTDDVRRRLFVPFFTTKDVGQGTGLGLSVAHGIVSQHGGRIDVETELGKGSTFIVRLPANPAGETKESNE